MESSEAERNSARAAAPSNEVHVPAREGRALRLSAGEHLEIVDLQGDQACDFFAFVDGSPREFLSVACTRWPGGDLLPREGTVFLTNLRRPIVTLVEDGADGVHDMLVPACSEARYRQEWQVEGHPSCQENCRRAASDFFELPYEYVPEPINFFTRGVVTPDMRLELLESRTPAGAYVVLRAELDLIAVVSACPMDLNRCNDGRPTDLLMRIGGPLTRR